MNPEELLTKSKEELIKQLEKYNFKYDEVMQNLVMIRQELLSRLKDEKKDGEIIGEYQISKNIRITFKISLEEAKELGAVKEVPDNDKLKTLKKAGVKVPGYQTTEYLSVRRMKEKGGDENA